MHRYKCMLASYTLRISNKGNKNEKKKEQKTEMCQPFRYENPVETDGVTCGEIPGCMCVVYVYLQCRTMLFFKSMFSIQFSFVKVVNV